MSARAITSPVQTLLDSPRSQTPCWHRVSFNHSPAQTHFNPPALSAPPRVQVGFGVGDEPKVEVYIYLAPMYRVFESMDQLVNHLEQAMGVPMTSNCMVPRNEMLALLDEMRNAIPVELDDAQDVLDNQDEIIRSAEERAAQIVGEAEAQADDTITRAETDS